MDESGILKKVKSTNIVQPVEKESGDMESLLLKEADSLAKQTESQLFPMEKTNQVLTDKIRQNVERLIGKRSAKSGELGAPSPKKMANRKPLHSKQGNVISNYRNQINIKMEENASLLELHKIGNENGLQAGPKVVSKLPVAKKAGSVKKPKKRPQNLHQ